MAQNADKQETTIILFRLRIEHSNLAVILLQKLVHQDVTTAMNLSR